MFDVIAYLDARNIPHPTDKNVSEGWVGIRCVYPMCEDASNHLGINLDTGVHSCFVCGRKGGPAQLVALVDHCTWVEAQEVVKEFSILFPTDRAVPHEHGDFMLPKFHTQNPTARHIKYLQRRGYDHHDLIDKYNISFTGSVSWVDGPYGKWTYPWRIIIPVFLDGDMVNFTSRDITGFSSSKYKMGPNNIAIRPGGDCVYNLDRAGDIIALVEGPLDVWRIGDGAVAMLGTKFSEAQLSLIASKRPRQVFIVYDTGAEKIAKDLGQRMARLVPQTDYLWLPGGDPDTLNPTDLADLQTLLK